MSLSESMAGATLHGAREEGAGGERPRTLRFTDEQRGGGEAGVEAASSDQTPWDPSSLVCHVTSVFSC